MYHEFGSKNHQGGFNSLNGDNKSVRQYKNTSGVICHVKILDKYLQKIPDEARSADNFYLTPVAVLLGDTAKPWFTKVPMGKNTLNKMLKEMCQEPGLPRLIQIIVSMPMGLLLCFRVKFLRKSSNNVPVISHLMH